MPVAYRTKTIRGRQVKQLIGTSRTRLNSRLSKLQHRHPEIEIEAEQFHRMYKNHKAFVNDPRYAGTKAQADSKRNLVGGKQLVHKAQRALKQIRRLREITR